MQQQSRIFSGTVAASVKRDNISAEQNPRTRRFIINPAIASLDVHPRLSGLQQSLVPYGFPVRIDTFPDMSVPTWSVDAEDRSSPVTSADLTAKEAVENILRAAWQSSADMGVRELTAVTSASDEEAERLLNFILPELDPATCPYAKENTQEVTHDWVEGSDPARRVARTRKVEEFRCLTCTLAWLESDECREWAQADGPRAAQLHTEALAAFKTNRAFFTSTWQQWRAEMQKRDRGENGIAVLLEGHLHVMRQLHEVEPAKEAAETLKANQTAQADAMREGMREVAREMKEALIPQQQPAFDMEEIVRQATERAKEELRAEMAEKEQPKGNKGGR